MSLQLIRLDQIFRTLWIPWEFPWEIKDYSTVTSTGLFTVSPEYLFLSYSLEPIPVLFMNSVNISVTQFFCHVPVTKTVLWTVPS